MSLDVERGRGVTGSHHFDNEIQVDKLNARSDVKHLNIKPQVDKYTTRLATASSCWLKAAS